MSAGPENDFEQMKQRYQAEARQKLLAERQARQKLLAERQARGLSGDREIWLPNPLAPGVSPAALASAYLDQATAQIRENGDRQGWLAERASRLLPPDPVDQRREETRLALGAALSAAVASGLIDEQRAVAMILAGRVNNQPLSGDDAREQVRGVVAQAVSSQALSRARAEQVLALLALPEPPEDQLTDDPWQVLLPGVPLADLVDRLEGLLYDALRVRPCHDPSHDDLHRASATLCPAQLTALGGAVLDGLGLPTDGLPRAAHREPDGTRSACCARDSRTATWLLYGQTVAPAPDPTPA